MTGTEALLIGATVAGAASSVAGGIAGAKAAAIESAQAKEAAEDRRIQGLQEANQVRAEAERVQRRNIALRAVSGLGLESGSFLAIQRDVQRTADGDVKNVEFQAASEANRFELQGKSADLRGTSSLVGGFLGAGTTLLRGGYHYKKGS